MATSLIPRPSRHHDAGTSAERRSQALLWWIPLSPLVGFVAAELLLDSSWPLWQVVPLASALATPFVVGAVYALHAVQQGSRRAWILAIVHVAFAVLAVVMPISESITR